MKKILILRTKRYFKKEEYIYLYIYKKSKKILEEIKSLKQIYMNYI